MTKLNNNRSSPKKTQFLCAKRGLNTHLICIVKKRQFFENINNANQNKNVTKIYQTNKIYYKSYLNSFYPRYCLQKSIPYLN